MTNKEIKTALKNLSETSKKLDKKDFKLMFFVADSKGTPLGSLTYTYELAYKFSTLGYSVQMLYSDNEFVGVGGWMGEKYSSLPHFNIGKDNVDISACDFLFIPELYTNVMTKTKNLPCKKIAILQNFNYLTDLIPFGASWETMGINDCITTSFSLAIRLDEIFPNIKTYVIRPSIADFFKNDNEKANLIVNIVSKDEKTINSIVKPFKWKYPLYDFVTFRYLNGRSRDEFAKYLSEGSITVWEDTETDFGYSPLEAMACGNIVIGKIPENEPEWMLDKNGELLDNGVWYFKTRDVHKLIADVVQTLLYDKIPSAIYENMYATVSKYTDEKQMIDVKSVFEETILPNRKKEIRYMEETLKKNLDNQNNK